MHRSVAFTGFIRFIASITSITSIASIASVIVLVASGASSVRAAAPPTTTTHLEQLEPLIDGSIRYLPPAKWELLSKSDDRKKASYKSPDGHGRIDIDVTVEDRDVP